MRKMFAAAVIACACLSARAVMVLGNPNCAEWQDSNLRNQNHEWLLGFLSGVNAELVIGKSAPDFLKDVKANQIFLWMDNYCKAHPLSSAGEGADTLAGELMDRALKNR